MKMLLIDSISSRQLLSMRDVYILINSNFERGRKFSVAYPNEVKGGVQPSP